MKTIYQYFLLLVCCLAFFACTQRNTPTGDTVSSEDETGISDDDVTSQVWSDTITIVWNGSAATIAGEKDGINITNSNGYVTIRSSVSEQIVYALSGNGSGQLSIYGVARINLTMNSLTLTCSDGPAINNQCDRKCFVVVNGTNSLTDGSTYATSSEDRKATLFSEGQLIFSGSGTLNVKGNYNHAITGDDYIHLTSSAGSFSLTAKTDGMHANDAIYIDGGTVTISAGDDGIQSEGDLYINDGNISIVCTGTSSGNGGGWGGNSSSSSSPEGIEAKGTITITGGTIYAQANDDAINSGGDMTISGGYVCAYSTGNDGIDANGNCYIKGGVIYAIGASGAEVAIDANSEEKKQLYIQGGTLVAIGGLENGASLTQTCYSTSSWSKNTWYALTVGSTVFAFKTPSSGGNTLVVSGASTPSLLSSVSVSNGTSLFNEMGNMNPTVSGGSTVTLTTYSGGNSGGGGGGPGGGGPGGGGGRR